MVFVELRLPALVLLNNLQVLLLDSGWIIILGKVLAAESCWNLCILLCLAISSGDCKDIHGLPFYGSLLHMHTIPPPKENPYFSSYDQNGAALNAESTTLYCDMKISVFAAECKSKQFCDAALKNKLLSFFVSSVSRCRSWRNHPVCSWSLNKKSVQFHCFRWGLLLNRPDGHWRGFLGFIKLGAGLT